MRLKKLVIKVAYSIDARYKKQLFLIPAFSTIKSLYRFLCEGTAMTLKQLKSLVTLGESKTLEFKTSTGTLDRAMETVCAFLNSDHGGTVLIGIKDDGNIVGQEINDSHFRSLATEIKRIEPLTKIDVKYVAVNDMKKVIVLSVDSGQSRPYTYDGRAFTRIQSTTSRMTREEYDYFYNKTNPQRWESLINNSCTISDLDKTRIKTIARMGVAEKRLPQEALTDTALEILNRLGLTVNGKFINAAVILFSKKEKQLMHSSLKLARFRGINKDSFLDNKPLQRANAFDLYDIAMEFLHFNLPVAAHIEPGKSERVETPAIPYNVLREAVTNALIHRDYSNTGGDISIARYDDRIEITNIGKLPKGVKLSELSKKHVSVQRNPLIANAFYICGKFEKWGSGTNRMIQSCKEAGVPIPEYEEIGDAFSVTIPLKEPTPTIVYIKPEQSLESKLTDRQRKILDVLKSGPLSRQQIMKKIKTLLSDRTMQLELSELKKIGLVKSHGKAQMALWFLAP